MVKQTIILEPGFPVDDFEIEKIYQDQKNSSTVTISSTKLLDRFRAGVVEEDIKPFTLRVFIEELDDYFEVEVGVDGRFEHPDEDSILDQAGDYLDRILWKHV